MGKKIKRPETFYQFIWKKGDDKLLMFPVKMKTVYRTSKGNDNMVCTECETRLKQRYVCETCGRDDYTVGKVEKKKNSDTGAVFRVEDYRNFMKTKIPENVVVNQELKFGEFFPKWTELMSGVTLEIHNNKEDFNGFVHKMRQYLLLKNNVLLATCGYSSKVRKCVIYATPTKVVMAELKDSSLVRSPYQDFCFVEEEKEVDKVIADFATDEQIERYNEFLEMVGTGKVIEKPAEEQKMEVKTSSWLDDELDALKVKV